VAPGIVYDGFISNGGHLSYLVKYLHQKKHRCPDGRVLTVFHDPDDAFALYLKKTDTAITAGAGGPQDLTAKLTGSRSQQVDRLLVQLDEQNRGLMMEFRAVYVVYHSDPCGNAEWFRDRVDSLIDGQQILTRARIMLPLVIELAQLGKEAEYSELYRTIIDMIRGASPDAAKMAIEESRRLAVEFGGQD
jgi:hypothetical protein